MTTSGTLDDMKVHVKVKLSALWAAIMFCYVYGDFWGLFRPGNLRDMLHGGGPLGPVSQGTLLAVSVLVAIPAVMIFLSLVLAPRVNRWLNIVIAAALTIIIVLTLPGAWTFYLFFSGVEIALHLTTTTIALAWRWPRTRPMQHAARMPHATLPSDPMHAHDPHAG